MRPFGHADRTAARLRWRLHDRTLTGLLRRAIRYVSACLRHSLSPADHGTAGHQMDRWARDQRVWVRIVSGWVHSDQQVCRLLPHCASCLVRWKLPRELPSELPDGGPRTAQSAAGSRSPAEPTTPISHLWLSVRTCLPRPPERRSLLVGELRVVAEQRTGLGSVPSPWTCAKERRGDAVAALLARAERSCQRLGPAATAPGPGLTVCLAPVRRAALTDTAAGGCRVARPRIGGDRGVASCCHCRTNQADHGD
jgi:hypothetical protein